MGTLKDITPKKLAEVLLKGLTYDEARRFAYIQVEVSEKRPSIRMYWREVLSELLLQKPKRRS